MYTFRVAINGGEVQGGVALVVAAVQYGSIVLDEVGEEGAVTVDGGHVECGAVQVVFQLRRGRVLEQQLDVEQRKC